MVASRKFYSPEFKVRVLDAIEGEAFSTLGRPKE